MEQLEGFSVQEQENKLSNIEKYLYDLKKDPKQWHVKFDNLTISNEFKVNESH